MTPPFVLSQPPSPSSTATSVLTYDSRASSPRSCIVAASKTKTHRSTDPYTFGLLFPSLERLSIRHDDASVDGHLNLRVDIATVAAGRPMTLQLFHLRMHHLGSRRFSLRRYGRDSGRDVCVCKRLYKNGGNHDARHSLSAVLRTLEFSNYARIAVRRRSRNKRYEFNWWGDDYAWKRESENNVVSFHLLRQGQRQPLAYIVPESRTGLGRADSSTEWVPPCSLWIVDKSVVDAGVAEIIVATGLIALVDDCIRRGSGSAPCPPPSAVRPRSDLKPRLSQTTEAVPRPRRSTVRGLFSRHPQTHRSMAVC
ncbi:hypothetical protein L249_3650 [Ophiocordyceps polyrhachis-furcata BCC 54312]|uniref:Uncharacterized protein n=1 Tax=Ophiocordyceps polyrhachis-furcata BCC 54312 TaxID=1330021 RepID=A0A367L4V8_9HYPO|nr:hypothetical protein L249_3650 [Ophiocordyceps polyrhachis-furcata BCC 54312]